MSDGYEKFVIIHEGDLDGQGQVTSPAICYVQIAAGTCLYDNGKPAVFELEDALQRNSQGEFAWSEGAFETGPTPLEDNPLEIDTPAPPADSPEGQE